MTFSSLWGSPSTTPTMPYRGSYAPPDYYAGERGDSGGYSHAGSSKKSDKKQAAMSALTLIAFLFFLNILQNCLRDQQEETQITTIMLASNALQGRDPDSAEEQSEALEKINDESVLLKTRKLLSVEDNNDESSSNRRGKFIHDFGVGARDWTNELSQVTDEDLVGQKQKVDQLRQLWNSHRYNTEATPDRKRKPSLEEEVMRVKVKKFVNNPVLSDIKGIPKLSQYWAAQKTTTPPPEPKYVEFENPAKKVADFDEFQPLSVNKPQLLEEENSILQNAATSLHLRGEPVQQQQLGPVFHPRAPMGVVQPLEHSAPAADVPAYKPRPPVGVVQPVEHLAPTVDVPTYKPRPPVGVVQPVEHSAPAADVPAYKPRPPVGEVQTLEHSAPSEVPVVMQSTPEVLSEPARELYGEFDALNTPRYRRSDEQLTTLPTEQLFHPEQNQVTPNPSTEPLTSTVKTYHVYTHPSQMFSSLWKTTPSASTPTTALPEPSSERLDIDSIYLTTIRPMPSRGHGQRPAPRPAHPANHRQHFRPATGYQYSPYRRVAYEPAMVRQEYYPMSVVGQYSGEAGSSGPGLLQLLWTLVTTFARPIASLVPHASKVVGGGEAQCFDLLACEAHRVGKFMGPTAQAIATTFSSLLTWVVPETDKAALQDAIAAAREDSCSRQIEACDDRSGGKSAITMVAKLMELKAERRARLPKGVRR